MTASKTSKPTITQPLAAKTEEPKLANEKYKFFLWEFETPIKWFNVLFYAVWHIVSVWALYKYPFWNHWGLVIYGLLLIGLGGFGVTAGVHRYWAHKSYKAKLPLQIILLFCFSLAGQSSIIIWARDHRVHHKFSETNADPYNVKRGFFFAHMGWLMMKRHPELLRKGKSVDISDLLEDPIAALHGKYHVWFQLMFCFVLPTLIARHFFNQSWEISILAVCFVRYVFTMHFTFSVNSIAHLWGNRPYDKRINPAENLFVSFLAMGEGYHNYHHTFPLDYRAAEYGKTLNITTLWINIFKSLGWAYDLKTPSPELVKKMMENHGDGSQHWDHEVRND